MSNDLNEFHDAFFEESFEAIDEMEAGLLELDIAEPDAEVINTIFRGAHSMKGGAGMFGFSDLTGFTHTVETVLDEVRNGTRHMSEDLRELFLAAVDCCRAMVDALKSGSELESGQWLSTKQALDQLLVGDPPATSETNSKAQPGQTDISATTEPESLHPQSTEGWRISFKPLPSLLKTGNEPLRIIREIELLGDLSVELDTTQLPPPEALDPEVCYLSWQMVLRGEVQREELEELFEWVSDDCELEIEPLINEPAAVSSAPEAVEPLPTPNVPKAAPSASSAKKSAETGSIRVSTEKVDALINLVGELVITQSMLSRFGKEFDADMLDELRTGLTVLERNTRELQESVMQIRMLPIKHSFSRFPRLVRDLAHKLNKKVELILEGEQTELDKTVLEKMSDPLVHLVRNSLDHGIETPETRLAAGKPEVGTLKLNAYHAGGEIVIEIIDDGAGIDQEKIRQKAIAQGLISDGDKLDAQQINNLIFHPGLSTADAVSDVSGRGVGMDVVRRNIQDLGGSVEIESTQGEGSKLTIRLPLTLAILDGQLIEICSDIYIIPLISIIETLHLDVDQVGDFQEGQRVYRFRGEYIPIIPMKELFGLSGSSSSGPGLLVVVEAEGSLIGLRVDALAGQQQVVIKSLEANYRQVPGLSGATILGDGTVSLILDPHGLLRLFRGRSEKKTQSMVTQ